MDKAIIHIDGGLGRVVASTGAIRRFHENNPHKQIIVISSWPDVFANNPHVHKVYPLHHAYLWDDVIKQGQFHMLEPYYDHRYYNQQMNLADSFDHLLNGDNAFVFPELYLTPQEKAWGISFRQEVEKLTKSTKIIAYQPYGATARLADGVVTDESHRSLPKGLAEGIPHMFEPIDGAEGLGFINFSRIFVDKANVAHREFNIREYFAAIAACDYFLGIDSSCSHISTAFRKFGTLMLGGTFKENVSYPEYKVIQREGYPQSYNPNRFAGWVNQNQGAMDYTQVEIDEIREHLFSVLTAE